MGFNEEVCVNATVGMPWWPTKNIPDMYNNREVWRKVGDGAIHLGYKVLTCNQILHGGSGDADWAWDRPQHYANLEFYTEFY